MARGFFFFALSLPRGEASRDGISGRPASVGRGKTVALSGDNNRDEIRSIVRRYYTVWWFQAFGPSFIFAIYPLFMRWRGLNQLQINTVAATFFFVTFATDIPTGAFADAIGRRTAFLIGSALSVIGFTIYYFAHHFPMFLLGECFDGVGFTFRNGAVDAWAVDALDGEGFTGTKDRLFSRVAQLMRIGNMCGALIGAYVGAHNLAIPWLLGASGLALSGFVGGSLMDRQTPHDGKFDLGVIAARVKERTGEGMRIGFGTKVVLLLALAGGIQLAAWGPSWFEWPAYFSDHLNAGVQVVGWLFCLFNLAGMAGSEIAARVDLDRSRRAIFLAAITALASLLMWVAGAGGSRVNLALVMFVLTNFCGGLTQPVQQSWFNEQIDGEHRATLLSFQTTFATFGAAAGLPAGGRVADRYGIGVAWQIVGMLSMLSVPCYWALRPRVCAPELAAEPAE
jgi:MFS family permease